MMLWKREVDLSICSYSSRNIDAIVKSNLWGWRFIGFHGNPNARKRLDSWSLIESLTMDFGWGFQCILFNGKTKVAC